MISPVGGLSRLRLHLDDPFAILRSMKAADIPDAALQGVAGVGGADLAVVALRVLHLPLQVLGVEDALRILDGGQKGLQEDVKADVAADVLDARIRNAGVLLPRFKMAAPLGIPSATGVHFTRDMMRAYSTAFSCQGIACPLFFLPFRLSPATRLHY